MGTGGGTIHYYGWIKIEYCWNISENPNLLAMSPLNVELQTSFMSFRPAGEILAFLNV